MLNRGIVFRQIMVAFLLGGLLGFADLGESAESAGAGAPEKLGLEPSEEQQVRQTIRFMQAILNQVNAQQATPQPQAPSPESNPLFGPIESYLQDTPNAWYVILTKLALAAFFGLILALVYRASYTGKRKKYSASMMQSQLLLAVGGSLVWIVVATSLVRAFGLAGMVGLIRYRTPVRDPKDNVMVFLSMAVGMACGLGQATVALVSTAFICLVLLGIHEFRLGKKKKKKKEPEDEEPSAEVTA